jgi:hypothetical protein
VLDGTNEDFKLGREILIDNLFNDIGLAQKDQTLRRLFTWVAWPPYGWFQNECGQYSMMTLVDQITHKKIVPFQDGALCLRRLLRSQIYNLRLLAARTLMVLGEKPLDPLETMFFSQSLNASDFREIFPYMARFRWIFEGNDYKLNPNPEFAARFEQSLNMTVERGPRENYYKSPSLNDPLYRRLAETPAGDTRASRLTLDALKKKYPGDWFIEAADAFEELSVNPASGEKRLKVCMDRTPGDTIAHLTLATWLRNKKRFEEAREIYFKMVERWPWDFRAVGNAMWSVTRDLID